MSNNKLKIILSYVATIIRKLHCKITCCCSSSCNSPTKLKWVDDNNNKKTIII